MLAGLVCAGCFSTAPRPSGSAVPGLDADIAARFGAPVLVGKGGDTETSLAVGPDGTILACSHGGFTQAPPLWVSRDGGKTFARQTIGETSRGGDCDVAVGSGAWQMVYTAIAQCAGVPGVAGDCVLELRLATSLDEGKTWSISTPIPGTNLQDRSWMTAVGDTLDLVYLPSRPNGFSCLDQPPVCNSADSLGFARSTDGGRTWGRPTIAYVDPSQPSVLVNGHPIVTDSGRTIGIPLEVIPSTNDAKGAIVYAHSEDGGASWSSNVVSRDVGAAITFPSAAATPNGSVVVGYASGDPKRASVDLAESSDGGRTWAKPISLSTNASFDPDASTFGDVIASVGVAIDRHDVATVAWMEATNASGAVTWALHAGRVGPAPARAVEFAGVARPTGEGSRSAFEFLEVRESPADQALVLYSWKTPECKQAPAGATTIRNAECVELLIGNADP